MDLTKYTYVPSIRWRMGEYGALSTLAPRVKDRVVPFVTIPAIEYDFEEQKQRKSVQDHVQPFVKRFESKWNRKAWITVHDTIARKTMEDGSDVFTYVFDQLRSNLFASAVPAIPLGTAATVVRSVAAIVRQDRRGLGLSIGLEDLMRSNLDLRLDKVARDLDVDEGQVDLFVDLRAPSFSPYNELARWLVENLATRENLGRYRNLILLSTAWPESSSSLSKGTSKLVRHDWLFYKTLVETYLRDLRCPNFGDYTLVHPKFQAVDMRTLRPAGKVIYTISDHWWVRKGPVFRDNREQMHEHCAELIKTGSFKGIEYSFGDEYIDKCADRRDGPSNLTQWKKVTINHHITQVVDDVANFFGVT